MTRQPIICPFSYNPKVYERRPFKGNGQVIILSEIHVELSNSQADKTTKSSGGVD